MDTQTKINHHSSTNTSNLSANYALNSAAHQQSTQLRRMTSTSSDSGDSGVDPSYRQERKIFVGGVPSSVGPEELAQFFQSYGQVEEAFIIYDRLTGRHRGFGFVTFADMNVTKSVCSTRVFNLHGRKIECKRALKREEITNNYENNSNEYKSFRPNNDEPSVRSTSFGQNNFHSNGLSCPIGAVPLSYGQYRQSSLGALNPSTNWMFNPSFQTLPSIYHPFLNTHQQYVLSLPNYGWNEVYHQANLVQSPIIQEIMIPAGSATIAVPSMINL